MIPEIWWRNPTYFPNQLNEVGHWDVAFSIGTVLKKNRGQFDPGEWMSMNYPNRPWRCMLIGRQGTFLIDADNPDIADPAAVYPTWVYGEQSLKDLRKMAQQNDRVSLTYTPHLRTIKRFLGGLARAQERYDCRMHIHQATGFATLLNIGLSMDWEPWDHVKLGRVVLGNGQRVPHEQIDFWYPDWRPVGGGGSLDSFEARARFSLRSALWATKNWDSRGNFSSKTDRASDDQFWDGIKVQPYHGYKSRAKPGDMIECNSCSLSSRCKLFRKGSLCTVPTSLGDDIGKHFDTRDPEVALQGLSKIIGVTAGRVEEALETEQADGVLDGEVTKLVGQLWKQGVDFTKLIQPKTPLVKINNVNGAVGAAAATAVGVQDPHQLLAEAVAKLEAAGWPRSQITQIAVDTVLAGKDVPAYIAIEEATIVEEDSDDDGSAAN